MKIAGDSSTFRQSLIEAGADRFRNLPHSKTVDRPYDEDHDNGAQKPKPDRLEPGRRDAEVQSGSRFVPDAVVVARDDLKPIISGTKIAVESLAP